jgi:hypothetical protein
MRNLILLTLLCGLSYRVKAFSTTTCGHADILGAFTSYESCYAKHSTEIKAKFCRAFDVADRCVDQTLSPCFGDDTTLISSITQINLRKFIRKTSITLKVSEHIIDFLLNTCNNAPSKVETDNYDEKMFYWFDFVETDGDCARADVEEVQVGLQKCLVTQRDRFKVEFKKTRARARGNLKNAICSTLYDTEGQCWRTGFPACFSQREIDHIKEKMSSSFKDGYNLAFNVSTSSVQPPKVLKDLKVDLISCLEDGE